MLKNLTMPVLGLPRLVKRAIVLVLDAALIIASVLIAFYLRTGEWVPIFDDSDWNPPIAILASLIIGLPIFIASGLYREIFRHSGWQALITLLKSMAIYATLFLGLFTIYGVSGVPRTVGIIQPVVLLMMILIVSNIFLFFCDDSTVA
jgi:FlaA1/EpsC-like NDP-sugar epimerase